MKIKKLSMFLLALVLVCSQAFAYTITKTVEERFDDAVTGDSYHRVNGYLTLDSSHPAEGENFTPSQLGMASFTRVTVGPQGPAAWTANSAAASARNLRRFGFDYTANRVYVISVVQSSAGTVFEVSGPITYDLAYLTSVPFEALGPIS